LGWPGENSMKKLLTTTVILLSIATPASAADSRVTAAWECRGDDRSQLIVVALHKYATKLGELWITGTLSFPGNGYNFKVIGQKVGQKGAKLNGKPCKILPYDPKWEEGEVP
jgi:hypothetical protein